MTNMLPSGENSNYYYSKFEVVKLYALPPEKFGKYPIVYSDTGSGSFYQYLEDVRNYFEKPVERQPDNKRCEMESKISSKISDLSGLESLLRDGGRETWETYHHMHQGDGDGDDTITIFKKLGFFERRKLQKELIGLREDIDNLINSYHRKFNSDINTARQRIPETRSGIKERIKEYGRRIEEFGELVRTGMRKTGIKGEGVPEEYYSPLTSEEEKELRRCEMGITELIEEYHKRFGIDF